MLVRIAAIFAVAFLFVSGAHAQIIIGNGVGKSCYRTALVQKEPSRRHIAKCTDAIESNTLFGKDLAASHVNRGILHMRALNFSSALEDYDRALRLRPNLGAAFLNKGAALIAAGRSTEAIPILLKSIDLETDNIQAAHYNLGLAYELTGDITSAYQSLKRAAEISPDWNLPKTQLERYSIVSQG